MRFPVVRPLLLLAVALTLNVTRALAQGSSPGADARTAAAMGDLSWLVGDWEGEAWIELGPGRRETVAQTERVEARLDGRVLLLEGIGRTKAPDGPAGDVVHHALAVVSYDPDRGRYLFRALRDGRVIDAETSLDEGVLTWGFDAPGAGRVRYVIREEAGEWRETGEFSRDGTSWRTFFEMRLRRVERDG